MPFAPGGAADFVARIIQPRLTEQLGQQVVIDNRTGAAGNIGTELVARASPDGYTIKFGSVGTAAINPAVFPKFPVVPVRDLIGITQITDVPGALVVHPSLPVKSVTELVTHLKANPNKLNYGSPAASSANRLEMEMFLLATGTRMTHVPYKGGAGPAVTALLGNEVQAMFVTFSSVVNFTKQGRLRMLAVVSPVRNPLLPDIPTMPEVGHPKLTSGTWQALFVPKGTPAPVVKKLFAATTRTMEHPEVVSRIADGGARVVLSKSPADFLRFWQTENERFARVVRDAGIETE
ncbi:MAG TPA: tripartite tricarboxylate transporter substrate-binding protein [Burkholderiales bacterium]|nr:tripartite tricarboxylate transporter substrate-binding protein [Burkholderiales bacterium]